MARLDREKIVDEALALLDEVGLDALSTRAVAERLGVRQPALYWHFRNRRALLDAMNDRILATTHTRSVPWPNEPWRDFLFANARSFRHALLSRRDGARVHAGTVVGAQAFDAIEQQLACLTRGGMALGAAADLLIAIGRYTVGCVLEEQAEDGETTPGPGVGDHPLLAAALAAHGRQGADASFEAGLAMLIDGAAARRERDTPGLP